MRRREDFGRKAIEAAIHDILRERRDAVEREVLCRGTCGRECKQEDTSEERAD